MTEREWCRFILFSATSTMHMAMLEQWSAALSRLVSRSSQIKPVSMEQTPFLRRRTWAFRMASFKSSMTCPSGSMFLDKSRSFCINAVQESVIISDTAPHRTSSSLFASSVNCIFFSLNSSADSRILMLWSEMRSRSPITFNIMETIPLSASLIW